MAAKIYGRPGTPLSVCSKCGGKTRMLDRHIDGPKCIVNQTYARYAAREWVRCGHASILFKALKMPVEYAPGGCGNSNRPKVVTQEWLSTSQTFDVPFAPRWAVFVYTQAARAFAADVRGQEIRREVRERLLKRGSEDASLREALEGIDALGGEVPMRWWGAELRRAKPPAFPLDAWNKIAESQAEA